jgi:hypothetical protein
MAVIFEMVEKGWIFNTQTCPLTYIENFSSVPDELYLLNIINPIHHTVHRKFKNV